ncbi:MAG: ribosome recycling factor [Bacteroidales bacterium]|nr:ribosome recycling factor [Bacteroidales bacterium]
MNEEIEIILEESEERMENSLSYLEIELSKLRAGKATPAILDGITVDYYGVTTPLSQVSNINTPDPKSIVVQPWEKNMLDPIEKAIMAANIGLTPMNNGEIIRINVPPLTEERRVQLVKMVKTEGENAKISIRNSRKWANDELRRLLKEGLSEDIEKDAEDGVQTLTDKFTSKIDEIIEIKEKDIMTV